MPAVTIATAQPTDGARLPAPARAKLEALRSARDDARALSDTATAKVAELRNDLAAARRELAELETADHEGRLLRRAYTHDEAGTTVTQERDDTRLDAARQRVDRLAEQLERAERQRTERWQTLGRTVTRIEEWLAKQQRPLAACEVEAPKLAKGADLPAEIEKARDLLQALAAERRKIEAAPVPTTEAQQRIRRFVAGRAARVRVGGLLTREGVVRFPQDEVHGVGLSPVDLACFLDPDRMARRLEAEFLERAETAGEPLSELDQTRALKAIDDRILTAERREEALVCLAEEAGSDVLRRPDADPRAVLGVE
jgi:hypothetical protein